MIGGFYLQTLSMFTHSDISLYLHPAWLQEACIDFLCLVLRGLSLWGGLQLFTLFVTEGTHCPIKGNVLEGPL